MKLTIHNFLFPAITCLIFLFILSAKNSLGNSFSFSHVDIVQKERLKTEKSDSIFEAVYIKINNPVNGSYYFKGTSIILNAETNLPDSLIQSMVFKTENAILGESSVSPYTIFWNADITGQYNIFVTAILEGNDDIFSDTVTIRIIPETEIFSKTITVSEDTWVAMENPEKNYNGITDLECGSMDTDTLKTREVYLKFDLGEIKGTVIKAKLVIKSDQKFDQGWLRLNNFHVEVLAVENTWSENELNWNNRPEIISGILAEKNITREDVYTIDGQLATFINGQLTIKSNTLSLVLRGKYQTPGSRIWVSDKSWIPAKLTIEYILEDLSATQIIGWEKETSCMNIFPNPANQNVMVSFDNETFNYFYLLDASGKIIIPDIKENKHCSVILNLERLPAGLYILVATDGKDRQCNKLYVR